MNPKVEKFKNNLEQPISGIVEDLTGIYIVFYILISSIIILSFIYSIEEGTIYLGVDSILMLLFVLSLCLIPCSVFYFLFTKNHSKMHKIIFYGFSIPVIIICEAFLTDYIYFILSLVTYMQLILTVMIFLTKEKIQKDVIFLYIIPVNISSLTLLYFELMDNYGLLKNLVTG